MTPLIPQLLTLFARAWMLPVAILAAMMVGYIGWRTDARRRARLAQLGDIPVLERLVPRRVSGLPSRVRALIVGVAALCV